MSSQGQGVDLRKSPTTETSNPIQSLVQQLSNMANAQTALQQQQQQKLLMSKALETGNWGNIGGTGPMSQLQPQHQPHGSGMVWDLRDQYLKMQMKAVSQI